MIDIRVPPKFECLLNEDYRYYVFKGGRGSAKCVAPETRIIMFDGTIKKADQIIVGDRVMGPDSTPRIVIDVHIGIDQMYRVRQNQAIDYVVNSQHILALKKDPGCLLDGRYPQYDNLTLMPITEFSAKSERFKNHFHGYKTGVINFPSKQVLVDPYFLGIWLGDGEASCQRVTTMDQEVIAYCRGYAESLGCKISIYDKQQKSCTIGIVKTEGKNNPLLHLLRNYDLLNNKHIPNDYLINSAEIRMQLLAGILDSDAHIANGCAYLTSKSEEFLKQVKYLADALGFRTPKQIKHYSVPLNGKVFDAYKITISGNLDRLPFRIKRRIEGAVSKPNKDFLKTRIDIEPIGEGPFVGFELDGDHLFLLEDGTVCHNSHSLARFFIAKALSGKYKFLCTRELQNSIMESVYSLFKEIISLYKLDAWFHLTLSSIECVTGSEFIFKGLAHNINSIKSMEGLDWCWVEEADKVCQNSWDILLPTIRKDRSKLAISYNPTHEDDPVHSMFIVNKMPDSIVTEVNWSDNKYFPEVLKKEMEHMRATDYEKYLHIWEGQLRTISDAQVFKGKFVVEDFSSEGIEAFYHGMDFGFANDPSAVVRCFIKGQDLYIDREAYGHHVELTELHHIIRKVVDNRWYKIKADCARPETISFLHKPDQGGWNISPAKKYSGSILDGIEFLRGFRKIIVHTNCPMTANEFRRYSFKVDKHTNEILPIPMDDFNHCIVAGTMVATDKGDIPIEDIKIGDLVRTRSGFNKVLFAGPTDQNRDVVTVHTASGKSITCTPDHRIWTDKGFTRADALRYDDNIITIEEHQCRSKQPNGMVIPIIDIQNQKYEQIGYISKELQNTYTEKYGKHITVIFQKAFTYIILTATLAIIHLKILNWFLLKIMPLSTLFQRKEKNLRKNFWQKLDRLQKLGMVHSKELQSTEKSEHWHIKILCLFRKYVEYAVKNFYRNKQAIATFSVRMHANQNGEECKDLTSCQKNVQHVENISKPISLDQMAIVQDRVKCVINGTKRSKLVYDLTVENEHEFFADGILVSNCIDALRYALDDLIKSKVTIYDQGVIR